MVVIQALARAAAPRRAQAPAQPPGAAGSPFEVDGGVGQGCATAPDRPAALYGPVSLAAQELASGGARRRGAAARGARLLDLLEELRLALLEGGGEAAVLLRLQAALADEAPALPGDAGLRQLLAQIELRVAIEIARHGAGPDPSWSA